MAKLKFQRWAKLLIGMAIQGGAVSVVSTFGLASANALGLDVKPLTLEQFWGVFAGGAVGKAFIFLQHQPVPEWEIPIERTENNDKNIED